MKKFHDVLVLNLSYVPVHVVDWTKAISLIYNSKVRCLDKEYVSYEVHDWLEYSRHTKDFHVINSPNISIALPEIISLKTYVRLRPSKGIKFSRSNVIALYENKCAYCGGTFATKDLNLDHIIPKAQKGKTDYTNIISSCIKCNTKKGNRTPEQANMPLLFYPKKPEWTGGHKFNGSNAWSRFMDNVESKPEFNIDPEDLE